MLPPGRGVTIDTGRRKGSAGVEGPQHRPAAHLHASLAVAVALGLAQAQALLLLLLHRHALLLDVLLDGRADRAV